MKYGQRNALRLLPNVALPLNQLISSRPRLSQVVMFIMFVTLNLPSFLLFLTEFAAEKYHVCSNSAQHSL